MSDLESGGMNNVEKSDPRNMQELTDYVQVLLQNMQDKFQSMSDQILNRIDDMGNRIDDLERNIADLMTQAGATPYDVSNKSTPTAIQHSSSTEQR